MIRKLRHGAARLASFADRLSIQKRLIVSYLLLMLLPSIWISLYIFNDYYSTNIRELIKENEHLLEVERTNVANNIESMERTAQLTISDEGVIRYLDSAGEPSAEALIAFNASTVPLIQRYQYNNPDIAHIRLYYASAQLFEISPVFYHERRVQNKPWLSEVLASKGTERWAFEQRDLDPLASPLPSDKPLPKVALLRELRNGRGEHLGIAEVDMLLADFIPKTYAASGNSQYQMVIVDRKGDVYTSPDNPLWRETGLTPEALQTRLRQETHPESGFQFQVNGTRYLGISAPIEQIGAVMVQVVSLEDMFRTISGIRNRIILANVVLLVVLSVATYFLNSLILKKLHALSASMKRVHQGDFHVSIDAKGGGEIGELTRHFRSMLHKINGFIADAVNKEAARKEVELMSLRDQIDAHFLYNTLESIKMTAEIEGQYGISDALTSLGAMMRYNLNWNGEYVRLGDELNHIRNYVAIMNIRLDDRIELVTSVPDVYNEQAVLKMSLQPIVENAVKHGLKSGEGKLAITIRVRSESDATVIEISDNGTGLPLSKLEALNGKLAGLESPAGPVTAFGGAGAYGRGEGGRRTEGSGIGLRNVNRRIRLFYGSDYGLRIDSEEGVYTVIIMRIPYHILTGGVTEHA